MVKSRWRHPAELTLIRGDAAEPTPFPFLFARVLLDGTHDQHKRQGSSLGPVSLETKILALFLTCSLTSLFLSHIHPFCPSRMHYSSLPAAWPLWKVLVTKWLGRKT